MKWKEPMLFALSPGISIRQNMHRCEHYAWDAKHADRNSMNAKMASLRISDVGVCFSASPKKLFADAYILCLLHTHTRARARAESKHTRRGWINVLR